MLPLTQGIGHIIYITTKWNIIETTSVFGNLKTGTSTYVPLPSFIWETCRILHNREVNTRSNATFCINTGLTAEPRHMQSFPHNVTNVAMRKIKLMQFNN